MKKSINWVVLSLMLIITVLTSPFAAAQDKSYEVIQHELDQAQHKILELEIWIECQTDIRWKVHGLRNKETWYKYQLELQRQMLELRPDLSQLRAQHERELEVLRESHQRELEAARAPVQNTTVNVQAPKPDTAAVSTSTTAQETPSGEFPWEYLGMAVLLLLLLGLVFLVKKYHPVLTEWWEDRQRQKAAEATEEERLKAIAEVRRLHDEARQLNRNEEVVVQRVETQTSRLRDAANADPTDAAKENAAKSAETILSNVRRLDNQFARKVSDIEDAHSAVEVAGISIQEAALALEKAYKALEAAKKLFADLEQAANTPPAPAP